MTFMPNSYLIYEYNRIPEHAAKIKPEDVYIELFEYFTYSSTEESRRPYYNPHNLEAGTFPLKIYWLRKSSGIGFGIARNWKSNQIDWYKFGTAEAWDKFKQEIPCIAQQ